VLALIEFDADEIATAMLNDAYSDSRDEYLRVLRELRRLRELSW
jgi:hypothetical protein